MKAIFALTLFVAFCALAVDGSGSSKLLLDNIDAAKLRLTAELKAAVQQESRRGLLQFGNLGGGSEGSSSTSSTTPTFGGTTASTPVTPGRAPPTPAGSTASPGRPTSAPATPASGTSRNTTLIGGTGGTGAFVQSCPGSSYAISIALLQDRSSLTGISMVCSDSASTGLLAVSTRASRNDNVTEGNANRGFDEAYAFIRGNTAATRTVAALYFVALDGSDYVYNAAALASDTSDAINYNVTLGGVITGFQGTRAEYFNSFSLQYRA